MQKESKAASDEDAAKNAGDAYLSAVQNKREAEHELHIAQTQAALLMTFTM